MSRQIISIPSAGTPADGLPRRMQSGLLYLYSAMTDLARLTNDHELNEALKDCMKILSIARCMLPEVWVQPNRGERFTVDFDLSP